MAVVFVIQAAELKLIGLSTALLCDVLRLTLLIGDDGGNGGLAELQFALHTEQLLCTRDEGAVEREVDVTGFQELDDFVFLALVFQCELVLVVEGRLGVLVDVVVDLVADFGHHVELDVLLEDEVVVAFAAFRQRGVVAEAVLEAEGQVDGALGRMSMVLLPKMVSKALPPMNMGGMMELPSVVEREFWLRRSFQYSCMPLRF